MAIVMLWVGYKVGQVVGGSGAKGYGRKAGKIWHGRQVRQWHAWHPKNPGGWREAGKQSVASCQAQASQPARTLSSFHHQSTGHCLHLLCKRLQYKVARQAAVSQSHGQTSQARRAFMKQHAGISVGVGR